MKKILFLIILTFCFALNIDAAEPFFSGLTIENVDIEEMKENVFEYDIYIPSNNFSTVITPISNEPNNIVFGSGNVILKENTPHYISVMNEDGLLTIYKLNVYLNKSHAENISIGNIKFAFDSFKYNYSILIGSSVSELEFIVTTDSNTTHTILNNENLINGSVVSVNVKDSVMEEETYTFNIIKNVDSEVGAISEFDYTGDYQTFTAPSTGYYQLEAWGASGFQVDNKGGYTSGITFLTEGETIYVYVGETGKAVGSGTTFNGGTASHNSYPGGGATDFRLVSGDWKDINSLASRVMVAAGAGTSYYNDAAHIPSAVAGGLTGYGSSASIYGFGGSQILSSIDGGGYSTSTFGQSNGGTAGGSGYYGGAGANYSGGGGSSYISGHTGSVAINSSTEISPKEIPFEVRYVEIGSNGNTTEGYGAYNQIIEVEVYDLNGTNVALNKPVTSENQYGSNPMSWTTDGNKTAGQHSHAGKVTTIDLEQTYEISSLNVMRYYPDNRYYYETYVKLYNEDKTEFVYAHNYETDGLYREKSTGYTFTACSTGTTNNECSVHYSDTYFLNTVMIDGNGYNWSNVKENLVAMPNTTGGVYEEGIGHNGNGYAKITFLPNVGVPTVNSLTINGEVIELLPDTYEYDYNLTTNKMNIVVDMENGYAIGDGIVLVKTGLNSHLITITNELGYLETITINTNRSANDITLLDGIYINGVLLDNFDSSTLEYNLEVPYNTTYLNIDTLKSSFNQGVDISDTIDNVLTFDTSSKTVDILVTSEDGTATKTYVLNITRDETPHLKSVIFSSEDIVYTFNSNTLYYELSVPSTFYTTDISVTAFNENAVIDISNRAYLDSNDLITITSSLNGEELVYEFKIIKDGVDGESVVFDYTGAYQTYTVPTTGLYRLEAWGADTTNEVNGGAYTAGNVILTEGENLYVYVGQRGTNTTPTFNGGLPDNGGNAGGGATDFRLVANDDWTNIDSLTSRIMVAGAAGIGSNPGSGGGLIGYNGAYAIGATQLTYGLRDSASYALSSFGVARGGCTGGNGYFAGGAAGCVYGGGGGSSYISGHTGAVAINSATEITPKEIPFEVRYVELGSNGNSVDGIGTYNHITEVEVYDTTGTNVALNKEVITNREPYSSYHFSYATDGVNVINGTNFAVVGSVTEIDLGASYDISAIKFFGYYPDARIYYDSYIKVYNEDKTEFAYFYNSEVDGEYAQLAEGHTFTLCTTGTTINECSIHYSEVSFKDTVMIDGMGYNWTNVKGELVNMPKSDDTTYSSGLGHTGNGVAKITQLITDDYSTPKLGYLEINGEVVTLTEDVFEYDVSLDKYDTPILINTVTSVYNEVIGNGEVEVLAGNTTHNITVTNKYGETQIYKINFTREGNEISTITDIKLNGVSIPNFDPNTFDYIVTLPTYTKEVLFDVIKAYPSQSVTISDTENDILKFINNSYDIEVFVISEDGTTTKTYNITLNREVSGDIKDVKFSNVDFTFDPSINDYEVIVPVDFYKTELDVTTYFEGTTVTIDKNTYIEDNDIITVTSSLNDVESVYTFKIIKVTEEVSEEYSYTGDYQEFIVPASGFYKLEAWGATGYNSPNNAGYTSGNVFLNKGEKIYIYVGEGNKSTTNGSSFNGGVGNAGGAPGGGATDFRLVSGNWNEEESKVSRIMVAAGSGYAYSDVTNTVAGGLYGYGRTVDYYNSMGASQILPGIEYHLTHIPSEFGEANGGYSGGNGYYGGGGAGHNGGGGSSYISGHTGAVAINSSTEIIPKIIPFEARYIEIGSNQNYVDSNNHIVELEVYDVLGNNVALNKLITTNYPEHSSYPFSYITDGISNNTAYYSIVGNVTTLDLGQSYDIDYVKLFRYYGDSRAYKDAYIKVYNEDKSEYIYFHNYEVDGIYREYADGRIFTSCNTGTTNNDCSIHYSNKKFIDTTMIDGNGYSWSNVKDEQVLMPNPLGGTYELGIGHDGDGYAKITSVDSTGYTNPSLASLTVDGQEIILTDDLYTYDITLDPFKSTTLVEGITSIHNDVIGLGEVNLVAGVNVHNVVITNSFGETNIYTINITRPANNYNKLADIKIDDVSIDSFDSSNNVYVITVPYKTKELKIEGIKEFASQSVTVDGTVNDIFEMIDSVHEISILVISEDETSSNVYTVIVNREKTSKIKEINFEDTGIILDFDPDKFNYVLEVPANTHELKMDIVPYFSESLVTVSGDEYITDNDKVIITSSFNNETTTYTFVIDKAPSGIAPAHYDATGEYQTFTAPYSGYFKVELWGSMSEPRILDSLFSTGGYTSGTVYLTKGETLYVYVGDYDGFNGGGTGGAGGTGTGSNGGGATDVRLEIDNLNSRIMVAGGAGGKAGSSYYDTGEGGFAGGLVGYNGTYHPSHGTGGMGYGGTQLNSGSAGNDIYGATGGASPSGFGIGGSVLGTSSVYGAGGGGGGYFGGGAGGSTGSRGEGNGAGGGSSYISGHLGSNAIKSSTDTSIRTASFPFEIRYIEESNDGSTASAYSHIVEIEAYVGNTNVALGKPAIDENGTLQTIITDGNTSTGSYTTQSVGSVVTIDLGESYPLETINVRRYYGDSRTFYNPYVKVYNEDKTQSAYLYNYEVDGNYPETAAGKTLYITRCNGFSIECSTHYSGKIFTDTTMIDGMGYNWTDTKGELVSMPTPTGSTYETGGHTDTGYAIISSDTPTSNNNYLDSLTLNNGEINIDFKPYIYEYNIFLDPDDTNVDINAIPVDLNASLAGTGEIVIDSGVVSKVVSVTALNGEIRNYTINFKRELSDESEAKDIKIEGLYEYLCSESESYCNYEFSGRTNTYTIYVPDSIDKVSFDVIKANEFQEVRMFEYDGTNIPSTGELSLDSTQTEFQIEVEAEDGSWTSVYYYYFIKDPAGNNNLSSLTITNPDIAFEFDKDKLIYYLTIPNEYVSYDINAETEVEGATVEVRGNTNLEVGTNYAYVTVTSLNGEKKTYVISMYKENDSNNYLASLTIGDGFDTYNISPTFNKTFNDYVVELPSGVYNLEVDAVAESSESTVKVDVPSNLTSGINKIKVTVTSATGDINIYTVDIVKAKDNNAKLSDIEITGYDIIFSPSIYEYNIDVAKTLTSLDITAIPEVVTTTYEVINNNLIGKTTEILVETTAENGLQLIYTINVNKLPSDDATLSSIETDVGTLNEEFDSGLYEYTIDVENTVSTIDITGIPTDSDAIVTGNGVHSLVIGSNEIELTVMSETGAELVYTLTITRGVSDDTSISKIVHDRLSQVSVVDESNYLINVQNEVDSIDLTAIPNNRKATVLGNGEYDLATGENDIEFIVRAENGVEKSYTVKVVRDLSANDDIDYLFAHEGALVPEFEDTTIYYQVQVPNSVTSLTLDIETEDSNATYVVAGNENFVVGENLVVITVTAEDKINTKDYTLKVIREEVHSNDLTLSGLTISEGELTPSFDSSIRSYTAVVENNIESIDIAGILTDSTMKLVGNGTKTLEVGKNVLVLTVLDSEGNLLDYQVVVTRKPSNDASLKNLVVKSHVLNPGFTKENLTYYLVTSDLKLDFTVIEPTEVDATYEITGNELITGDNVVNIIVTAPDLETTMTYVINVEKTASTNNNLTFIETPYELTPVFNKSTTYYEIEVENNINDILIEGIVEEDTASIVGNGLYELEVGKNVITLTVTSEAGEAKPYVVVVNKKGSSDNGLLSLKTSSGTLSPTFDTATLNYEVEVESDVENIIFYGKANNIKSVVTGLTNYDLEIGENEVLVTVTAEDGSLKTYNVTVIRKEFVSSLLSELKVTGYNFDTPFNENIKEYTITVDNEVTNLDLSYVTKDINATVEVLNNENFIVGDNVVEVKVTSSDLITESIYKINVIRKMYTDNLLTGLIVKGEDLIPNFDPNTLEYDVIVNRSTTSVELIGTLSNIDSTVTGLGVHEINDNETVIEVVVTSDIGISRTYIVNIIKDISSNNYLRNLELRTQDGTVLLTPVFNKLTNNYTLDVTSEIDLLIVYGIAEDYNAVVTNDSINNLVAGENTINITVTAEDGSINVYTIVVTKEADTNNNITRITPSTGTLDVKFDPSVKEYTLNVADDATSLYFDVTKESLKSTVSGARELGIENGTSERVITITAEDGSVNTYTFTVIKEASNALLKSLSIKGYEINFDSTTFTYDLKVSSNKTKLLESEISYETIDSLATVNLMGDVNLPYKYVVEVIGSDNYTVQEYVINITNDDLTKSITSDVYDITDGYLIVDNIDITEVVANINNKENIKIYKDDTLYEGLAGTGLTVKLEIDNYVYDEVLLVVLGDLNGDSKINIIDKILLINHNNRVSNLTDVYYKASDINSDNYFDTTDLNLLDTKIIKSE